MCLITKYFGIGHPYLDLLGERLEKNGEFSDAVYKKVRFKELRKKNVTKPKMMMEKKNKSHG